MDGSMESLCQHSRLLKIKDVFGTLGLRAFAQGTSDDNGSVFSEGNEDSCRVTLVEVIEQNSHVFISFI